MSATLPAQVKEWLDAHEVVTVATVLPDGQPHLSVVWAKYDGEDILLSTLESRQKFRNLLGEPRATVLIFPRSNPYVYAELRGMTTMTREGGRALIDELSQAYMGEPYPEEPPEEVRIVVRLKVDKVAGRAR